MDASQRTVTMFTVKIEEGIRILKCERTTENNHEERRFALTVWCCGEALKR